MLKKLEKTIVNFLNSFAQDIKNYREPERWRDIPYYEGHYRVSSRGNVMSMERETEHPLTKTYTLKEKILKPSTENGFARVYLYYPEWKRERIYVHKMVAKMFLWNDGDFKYVNHKDGNRLNNNYWNLEWKKKRNSPR